tara:strand:- start:4947 stop:5261 length:315 start_codon:yes stop_codon:yes gene_type:complete
MPFLDTFVGYELITFSDGMCERAMFPNLIKLANENPYAVSGLDGVQVYEVYFVGVYYHSQCEMEMASDRNLKTKLLSVTDIKTILGREEQRGIKAGLPEWAEKE